MVLWGSSSPFSAQFKIAIRFLTGAIVARTTPQLTRKTTKAIWVDQWSLPEKKLQALEELVEDQLQKGHIVPLPVPGILLFL